MSRHACGAKCAYSRKRPSSTGVQPAVPWPPPVCASASSASRASRCVVKTAWNVPGACVRGACVERACWLQGGRRGRGSSSFGQCAWRHGRRWHFAAATAVRYSAMEQPQALTPPRTVVAVAEKVQPAELPSSRPSSKLRACATQTAAPRHAFQACDCAGVGAGSCTPAGAPVLADALRTAVALSTCTPGN